jgi:hypothetical protein
MKFATNLLRVNAALFIAFGTCFIVAPEFFADALTGSEPWTSSALIDMRATYGGMCLGVGLAFWFCARQRETHCRSGRRLVGAGGDCDGQGDRICCGWIAECAHVAAVRRRSAICGAVGFGPEAGY